MPLEGKEVVYPIHADLHIHTEYSMDSASKIEDIIGRCLKIGINCLAITDHGTIEGALKMKKIAPFKIIVGEEILTNHGEIIGMFLKENVNNGLSPEETVRRIREQDGLVYIPHPFDHLRSPLDGRILEKVITMVDIVEVYNSRTIFPGDLAKAEALAQKYGLTRAAGSDAHTLSEIGKSWVGMADFDNGQDFLNALKEGRIYGHLSNPIVHLYSSIQKIRKR